MHGINGNFSLFPVYTQAHNSCNLHAHATQLMGESERMIFYQDQLICI